MARLVRDLLVLRRLVAEEALEVRQAVGLRPAARMVAAVVYDTIASVHQQLMAVAAALFALFGRDALANSRQLVLATHNSGA